MTGQMVNPLPPPLAEGAREAEHTGRCVLCGRQFGPHLWDRRVADLPGCGGTAHVRCVAVQEELDAHERPVRGG